MAVCLVCSGDQFSSLADVRAVEEECELREQFIRKRLSHPLAPEQAKDLTDFFHAEKATIEACLRCGLLLRREQGARPAESYSGEQYDPAAIDAVYPQYLAAFRAKERPYRSLLPAQAQVIEIGSHYGAFLETAQEWGWKAEGIDIGEDTSRFAQSKGLTVHTRELTECGMEDRSRDAVFIWNCFEQLKDPAPTLSEAHRILKPGGLLVVRVPNGLFYSMCRDLLKQDADLRADARDLLLNAMGYNNLLGFPYQYGHSRFTLNRLIEKHGFRFEDGVNSELLTLPLPDSPQWVEQQEQAINGKIRMLARSVLTDTQGVLTGPWIEVWYRRVV